MKRYLYFSIPFLVFVVIVFTSCISTDKSDGRFLQTVPLKNGLFLENYEMDRGGVFAGNTYGYYLTDSNQFLEFIGFADDNDIIDYQFNKDSSVIVFTIKPSDTETHEGLVLKKIKLP